MITSIIITFVQVIQYLESTYLSPDSDKKATENEAKKFLINAVTSVATDIESAAGKREIDIYFKHHIYTKKLIYCVFVEF